MGARSRGSALYGTVRILFSFVGGNGHFEPLVPIARAARDAGHTVAFTASSSMVSTVEASGFPCTATTPAATPPAATTPATTSAAATTPAAITPAATVPADTPPAATTGPPSDRLPLLPVDMRREEQDLREHFVREAGPVRAAGIVALCADWRPDLLVCDEADFGCVVAAERLGLPYATVLVIAAGSFVRPDVIANALDEVRAGFGLPADPDLAALSRHLVLSPFPPSFRDPADPLPPTAHSIRLSEVTERAPAGAEPNVYFTLGTIFNRESGDLFQRVLAGLRDLPVNVLVTVGRHIDPAEFGAQPANIRIERYVPQAEVLPHCDLVVSHGGSGSVVGALAHGVPSVLVAMGADQPLNAARCVALGVGRVLDPVAATPADVREAVSAVLSEPSYRRNAERLRDEIAALPGPEWAVPLLERLGEHRPPP